MSILTQEMSKHFLHSKGEGDKYKVEEHLPVRWSSECHTRFIERMNKNLRFDRCYSFSFQPFQFFMKATQLEQMKFDFISIKTAKQFTEEKVSQNGEVSA